MPGKGLWKDSSQDICVNSFLPTAYLVLRNLGPTYMSHLLSCSPSLLRTSSHIVLLSLLPTLPPNSLPPVGLCTGCSWNSCPIFGSCSASDLSFNALSPARLPFAALLEAGYPTPYYDFLPWQACHCVLIRFVSRWCSLSESMRFLRADSQFQVQSFGP